VRKWRHGLRTTGGKSLKNPPSFLGPLLVCVALLCSCNSKPKQSTTQPPVQEPSVPSHPPFVTREPDKYQAERIYTFTNSNGGSEVRKSLLARDGELRREEFDQGDQKVVLLEKGEDRSVLLPDLKIYAHVHGSTETADLTELEFSPQRLLSMSNLVSTYQKLGPEMVDGRTATKYQIVVNTSSANNVSKDEWFMWFDESLGMTIRTESKSAGRQLVMELKNISFNVDPGLFEIPEGYKEVAATELNKRTR
jgi:outer membrane lipoprotein-sorting protein